MTSVEQVRGALQNDIVRRFLIRCEMTPDATAVFSTSGTITYSELSAKAVCIAKRLRTYGNAPKVLVFLEPGTDAYATIIATLMIGGTFCPINLNQPVERSRLILAAFEPDVVVAADGSQILGHEF